MDLIEMRALMHAVAAYDRRTTSADDLQAWCLALTHAGVTLKEAQFAVVEHFSESTEWLTPARVVQIVKRARTARLAHSWRVEVDALVGVDPDDVPAYLAALRSSRQELAETGQAPDRPVLPSRYEATTERAQRAHAGAARCHEVLERLAAAKSVDAALLEPDTPHARALARARAERQAATVRHIRGEAS